MTNRREFFGNLAAASTLGLSQNNRAPSVRAQPTVFYAHPEGERILVRITATGLEAPAGRLRLWGRDRQLLGTAGVIAKDGTLYGELWVPIQKTAIRVTSELEIPGRRNPIRTTHTISPTPRWKIGLVGTVDSDALADQLKNLPTWRRAAYVGLLRSLNLGGSIIPPHGDLAQLDHLPFLRMGVPARDLLQTFGVNASPIAIGSADTFAMRSIPSTLRAMGVSAGVIQSHSPTPVGLWESRDGTTLAAVQGDARADVTTLELDAGYDAMIVALEMWFTSAGGAYDPPSLFLILPTRGGRLAAIARNVTRWRSRFAYPRILLADDPELHELIDQNARTRVREPAPRLSTADPSAGTVEHATNERLTNRIARTEQMFAPLARLVHQSDTGLAGFANQASFGVDGFLVFNSSPMTRSDVAVMPNGDLQMVTNVPGVGFVFLPQPRVNRPEIRTAAANLSLSGQHLRVEIDANTGAVASLVDTEGNEWIDRVRDGLNHIAGARVDKVTSSELPNVGHRVAVTRNTGYGMIRSVYTVYRELPWIDIWNETSTRIARVPIQFSFALSDAQAAWETPAGFEERDLPTGVFAHLRWIQLTGSDDQTVFFAGLDTPYARADTRSSNGVTITSWSPGGYGRYRIDTHSRSVHAEAAWRFGWSAEPFHVIHTATGGNVRVPTFGRLLRVDSGALILGVKHADLAEGVVIYVQDVTGLERDVTIRPQMLQFNEARVVDLAERDLGKPLVVSEDGAIVSIPRYGVVAVQLCDLALRGVATSANVGISRL